MKNKIWIVIVNRNGSHHTLKCLKSIFSGNTKGNNRGIILVDNGSSDHSYEKTNVWVKNTNKSINLIQKDIGQRKKVKHLKNETLYHIKIDKNLGFSAGNNVAINKIIELEEDSYIMLLNNDTLIPQGNLKKIFMSMDIISNKKIILGPTLINTGTNIIQSQGGNINLNTAKFTQINRNNNYIPSPDLKKVAYISGACMCMHVDVFKEVGLLNEASFLYFEETDFCLRAEKLGISCYVDYNTTIYHKEGGEMFSSHPIKLFYFVKNMIQFEKTHNNNVILFILYFFFLKLPNILKKSNFNIVVLSKAVYTGLRKKSVFDKIY